MSKIGTENKKGGSLLKLSESIEILKRELAELRAQDVHLMKTFQHIGTVIHDISRTRQLDNKRFMMRNESLAVLPSDANHRPLTVSSLKSSKSLPCVAIGSCMNFYGDRYEEQEDYSMLDEDCMEPFESDCSGVTVNVKNQGLSENLHETISTEHETVLKTNIKLWKFSQDKS